MAIPKGAAKSTALAPSFVARVAAGVRYMVSGSDPSWFGPDTPLDPVTSPQEQPSVTGRQLDYMVGFNTMTQPRQNEPVSFEQMRALADGYDLLRLVIETRKDQLAALNWTIKPKDAKAKPDQRCTDLIAFFAFPDREHAWDDWLRMVLEDLFVLDAPSIYVRPTNGGQVYSLEPIDGATIKRVIDDHGRTPAAPLPAYQQILKGVPAIDYSADELIYKPRNPRTSKIYGYSPVEQIIMTVNIAIRRQLNQLSYYTDGNVPNTIFRVPASWNPDQIKQFQLWWDSLTSGQSKHVGRFIPEGPDPIDTKPAALKDEMDEWLARIVCFAFSVSPTPFIKSQNRATADNAKEQAMQEGLAPLQKWIKGLVDLVLVKHFGITDLEFGWSEEVALNPVDQATVMDKKIRNGSMTINESRALDGEEPIEGGDTPLIFTAAGAVTLDSVINPPPPPAQLAPFAGGNTDPDASVGNDDDPQPGGKETSPDNAKTGEKVAKAKKALRPIDRDRKAVTEQRDELKRALQDLFKAQAPLIAAQVTASMGKVAKKRQSSTDADQIDLDLSDWDDIVSQTTYVLTSVGKDGVGEARTQIDMDVDDDALSLANDHAIAYAKDRAAEMVGKKWVDGELVDNPDAQWVITDSTRTMINAQVQQAMEDGLSNDDLAAAIQDGYAFSDARAEMIARTETANADVQGNLALYKESGMVSGKQLLAAPDCCEECQDLNGTVVGLDDDFPDGDPPLHPSCRCDVLPVLDDDDVEAYRHTGDLAKAYNPDQPRDEHGRFGGTKGFIAGDAPVEAINAALGKALEKGKIFFSAMMHIKLKEKHGADYAAVMAGMKACLTKPDYIGEHPGHPGKIMLVKAVEGLEQGKPAMIVSMVGSQNSHGNFPGASAYGLKQSQLDRFVAGGYLKKT